MEKQFRVNKDNSESGFEFQVPGITLVAAIICAGWMVSSMAQCAYKSREATVEFEIERLRLTGQG